MSTNYKPEILNLENDKDKIKFDDLKHQQVLVFDTIKHQLAEYIKCLHPKTKFSKDELNRLVEERLQNRSDFYGNWIYYDWSRRLVHVLPKDEFITLRTNRNCYKITPEERDQLSEKIIGVIGLSVGQSIALTLAMERSFGQLRLADFDTLDLSNLNRIRAGIYNLGINKAIVTAREIYEIDPYLDVVCFTDGLHENNIDEFFEKNGKLDILIDECDGLDIKILARYKARSLKIPVFMDTSDRGMVDIERFDIEPDRPILHGLVGDLDPKQLKGLTNEQKVPYILPMIGFEQISTRLKASMMEIEESISTWPQLASSVVMGGGVGADITRKILLGQSTVSGRFYVDLDDIIPEPAKKFEKPAFRNPYKPLTEDDIKTAISKFSVNHQSDKLLSNEELELLVSKACLAPSGGNCQPWKWYYNKGILYLFHDKFQSYSLLDFEHYGSMVGLGAAVENLILQASTINVHADFITTKKSNEDVLMGYFVFRDLKQPYPFSELANAIELRETNRLLTQPEPIKSENLEKISQTARYQNGYDVLWMTEKENIHQLAQVLAAIERIRLMHPQGHEDFINEIRWSEEENLQKRNGVDIETVDLTASEIAGLKLAKDYRPIDFLKKLKKGSTFEKLMKKTLEHASAVGLLIAPKQADFLQAGRVLERVWLMANRLQLAFHPVSPATFMFRRIDSNSFEGFENYMQEELKQHHQTLNKLFDLDDSVEKIFLFKIFKTHLKPKKSLRKPLNEILIIQ